MRVPDTVADTLARSGLPLELAEKIRTTVEKSGLAPERAAEVALELITHCEDALAAGRTAADVGRVFGDPAMTGSLLRRAIPEARPTRRWLLVGLSAGGWLSDARLAIRTLARRPAFAALATLTLAAGIGIHTAVFSVAYGVLLRPLPYPGADRIVNVWQTNDAWRDSPVPILRYFAERFPASYPTVQDWDSLNTVFSAVGGYRDERQVLSGVGSAALVPVVEATSGVFRALDVPARQGRWILPEEDRAGAPQVAVVSEAFWRSALGSDPEVLGLELMLEGVPVTIVGVMPQGFGFPASEAAGPEGDVAVWRTFTEEQRRAPRSSQGIKVIARLVDGVTLARANEAMETLAGQLEGEDRAGAFGARVVGRLEEVVGHTRPVIALLLAAAAVVLLIACLNLANLLLIRGAERSRDFAVRSALGAQPARLARQLVSEGLVLGIAGGVVGVALAALLLRPLLGALPPDMPRLESVRLDPIVVGVSALAAIVTALFSTVLPVLRLGRRDLSATIQHGVRGTAGRERSRTRALLVIAQVAGAFVLVAGAGVLLRSFTALADQDPGFRTERVISFQIEPPKFGYPDEAVPGFHQRLTAALAAIPGVRSVGSAENLPYAGTSVASVNIPTADSVLSTSIEINVVAGRYFETLSIPVHRGRAFEAADREGAPPVMLVNEEFLRQFWPEGEALGRTVELLASDRRVVGIVADVRKGSPADPVPPMIYLPLAQVGAPTRQQRYVVAGAGEVPLLPAIRAAVAGIDPTVPVARVMTMDELTAEVLAQPRFRARLVGLCAGLAALLAMVGIYGVMMYSVLQSRRAIGIQMALGAGRRRIVRGVVRRSLLLASVGLAAGLGISFATFGGLEHFIYGVATLDPLAVVAAGAVIFTVAGAAAFVPAYRASRVDPMAVLRE